MTNIKMLYDNNLYCGFEMEGHADYNPGGPDVICASLSAASQMTVNGILDWIGVDFDDIVKLNNPRKGFLKIIIPSPMHESITVQQMFKSFELYVSMLSDMYAENITVERREGDD